MIAAPALQPRFDAAAAPSVRAAPDRSSAPSPAPDQVREKQARITDKAQNHFEKNRPQWIANSYRQLLAKDAPVPALKPPGLTEDRTARLLRAATHLTDRKQEARLQRIDAAAERMVKGERVSSIGR